MVKVTKRFSFEACHLLPYYRGACHNIHGHSYKLEVSVIGEPITDKDNEKCGMIIDFKDLKEMVKNSIISKYDHSNLNTYFDNPTAEIMVKHIGYEIMELLKDYNTKARLFSIKLWETEDSYAEFSPFEYVVENVAEVI